MSDEHDLKIRDLLRRYTDLCGKVDAFFARVIARYRDHMQCESGCTDCCRVRLTVASLEADHIRAYLAQLPRAQRAVVGDLARSNDETSCAALDRSGRCVIYESRPVVCRSHGAPIRVGEDDPKVRDRLPVIEVCHRNFSANVSVSDVAHEDVFDQKTLSTILYALDAAYCAARGVHRQREDLAAVLTS